jgi:2-hydroxychromene-2-carboxylate isomerase
MRRSDQEDGKVARPVVSWFHGAADPWSCLGVQLLPRLIAAHDVDVRVFLVPPPVAGAAPEPDRLMAWGLRDCRQLARAHDLRFPDAARAPDAESVRAVEAGLAGLPDPLAFAAAATDAGLALWAREPVTPGPGGDRDAALAEGAAALAAAGHYLPGVFAFEGECFWGVDRFPDLLERLRPFRRGHDDLPARLMESEATGDCGGAALSFFLSFRSPYTWLAAARVRALAERWKARLVLRPVLPMVMRGLPVPPAKQMYIVRDCMREAMRMGIPFGRVCDPVGPGVERGLAVLHRATALGRGPDFVESFLKGAFAEAVDATTEAGLLLMAERAGLAAADVAAALANDGWRAEAEANRAALFGMGLWGVPSFQVADRPGHWGQDRLWAVEADLRAEAGA